MSILDETPVEEQKGEDPPIKVVVDGNCALKPPRALYIGTGNRQKQYEFWLDRTLRKSFDERSKHKFGAVSATLITYELCKIAVKLKECESVVFEFKEIRHWVKKVDYEKAIRKVVGDHLGLLYNVAGFYGVPTKAPMHIEEKLPEGVLEALPEPPASDTSQNT